MALSSQILHIIMLFLFLLSLHTTRSTHIEKVSGVDENQQKEALIVEKFRLLLGLRTTTPSRTDLDEHLPILSPSPSPFSIESEPPSPSPAPALPVHVHSHAHPPQAGHNLTPHKVQEEEKNNGRARRILGAVLGSAGATILVCVLGFICICWKFRKHRRKISRTMPSFGNNGRSRSMVVTSHSSATNKVSGNPGLDLVYLHSLQMDLERENSTIKASPNQEEDDDREAVKSECDDNASSLSTKEIVSVHNDNDDDHAVIDSMSSSGDKIIYMDSHPSDDDDDESFHSCSDSHSCNARLSNASMGSLTDKSETFSPKPSKNSPFASPNPTLSPSNDGVKKITRIAPSPPPPPPPPPSVHFSPLKSTRIVPKASCSSTLPRIISPRNLTSENDSALPQKHPLASQGSSINIPPPPCPPPFVKGNGNPIKGPPPPPPQQQLTPLGKDGTPLPKLKPLHWDKVRATPDRSMVWDKMRSSSFELDEEMMESLFGYNLHNSAKNDETKSKSPSPGKHILDQKRLQNITILSKALNASAEQICYTLIQGEGLCLQQLEALAKMVPTKEEEMKLCSYKGDINELGSAERFVKAMLSVPFAFLRIESMLYKETFEDEVVHLRKSFSMLEDACKELRSSRLFLKLLEAVLKTGNRMNVGTIRGGARAFKLDTLLKLADVKGTDGKTTLLHFVVQEIIRAEGVRVSDSIMGQISSQAKTVEEREEEYRRMGLELVSGLSTELYNVKKTATIDLDVLASSVSNLSDGMAKLKKLVEKELCGNQNGGNFVESMREFLNYADMSLKKLQEDEGNVLLHVRQITEYFHGELSKADPNPLRIFVIVRDFLGMLDNVCKELRSFKAPSSPNPLAPFR